MSENRRIMFQFLFMSYFNHKAKEQNNKYGIDSEKVKSTISAVTQIRKNSKS